MVKTLVFIHGWASTSDIWQKQKEYFSQNFEVVTPDVSGAKDINEAVHILKDSLGNKKDYVLIGWSLGWLVILDSLQSTSLKPKGLLAVNSTAKLTDDGYLGTGLTDTHLAKMIRDCKRNPQKTFEDFYGSILTDTGKNILNSARPKNIEYDKLIYGLRILRDCDYREFIKEINIPTLLITGSKDTICPQEASLYMHKMIKGSELKIFDCGHMPFLDKPGEFNAVLENFIKGL